MELAKAIERWVNAHGDHVSASTRRDIDNIAAGISERGFGSLACATIDAQARVEVAESVATIPGSLRSGAIAEFVSVVTSWAATQQPATVPSGAFANLANQGVASDESAAGGIELADNVIDGGWLDEPIDLTEDRFDEPTLIGEADLDEFAVVDHEADQNPDAFEADDLDLIVDDVEVDDADEQTAALIDAANIDDTDIDHEDTALEDTALEEVEVEEAAFEDTALEDTALEEVEVEEAAFDDSDGGLWSDGPSADIADEPEDEPVDDEHDADIGVDDELDGADGAAVDDDDADHFDVEPLFEVEVEDTAPKAGDEWNNYLTGQHEDQRLDSLAPDDAVEDAEDLDDNTDVEHDWQLDDDADDDRDNIVDELASVYEDDNDGELDGFYPQADSVEDDDTPQEASSFLAAIGSSPPVDLATPLPVADVGAPVADAGSGAFSAAAHDAADSKGTDWITVAYFAVAAVCFALVIFFYLTR